MIGLGLRPQSDQRTFYQLTCLVSVALDSFSFLSPSSSLLLLLLLLLLPLLRLLRFFYSTLSWFITRRMWPLRALFNMMANIVALQTGNRFTRLLCLRWTTR